MEDCFPTLRLGMKLIAVDLILPTWTLDWNLFGPRILRILMRMFEVEWMLVFGSKFQENLMDVSMNLETTENVSSIITLLATTLVQKSLQGFELHRVSAIRDSHKD
jgi:hypothetical protein